jgi:hypothetical protein
VRRRARIASISRLSAISLRIFPIMGHPYPFTAALSGEITPA